MARKRRKNRRAAQAAPDPSPAAAAAEPKPKRKQRRPTHRYHCYGAAVAIVLENLIVKHAQQDLTVKDLADMGERYFPEEWLDKQLAQTVRRGVGQVLRSAKMNDQEGRVVRQFGCYRIVTTADDGSERSDWAWKSWKMMSADQQTAAVQAQVNQAAGHVRAVKDLIGHVNDLRKEAGHRPMRLDLSELKAG